MTDNEPRPQWTCLQRSLVQSCLQPRQTTRGSPTTHCSTLNIINSATNNWKTRKYRPNTSISIFDKQAKSKLSIYTVAYLKSITGQNLYGPYFMYCARSPNVLAGLPNILYIIEQLSVCMCVCVCVCVFLCVLKKLKTRSEAKFYTKS